MPPNICAHSDAAFFPASVANNLAENNALPAVSGCLLQHEAHLRTGDEGEDQALGLKTFHNQLKALPFRAHQMARWDPAVSQNDALLFL